MEHHLGRRRIRTALTALGLAVGFTAAAAHAQAPSAPARAGLALATSAARAWAPDAELVYLENDEPLDASGRSTRWGYLFRSASRGRARAWSVRDGRIVTSENLELRFEAPPLPSGWLDSDQVVAAAEKGAARASLGGSRGKLVTMLLLRGAESDEKRDATTWTFVYRASSSEFLHVVVDAATGKLQRTWRS